MFPGVKRPLLVLSIACAMFVFVVRPWELYFLNDDFIHIPMSSEWLFLRAGFMRPVANAILLFDRSIFNTNATGYHFTAYLFHVGCVFTVYCLTKAFLQKYFQEYEGKSIAFLTALFFLVYPFHAESLMWILARGSMEVTLFTLLSYFFYLKASQQIHYLWLSCLFFLIALFTYESTWNAILVYAALSVLDVKKNKLEAPKAWKMLGLMSITFGGYILLRLALLETIAGDGYLEINENLQNKPLLLANWAKLIARVFTPPFVQSGYAIVIFSLSAFVYILIVWKSFKRNRQCGLLMLSLWIGVVTAVVTATPLGIDTHYNESERFIYYASFFFCFFLAIAVNVFLKKKAGGIVMLSLFIASTIYIFISQRHYRYASIVAKSTLELVSQYPKAGTAYFLNVPDRYKGALIFRAGLKDAIKWIRPEVHYDSIEILSKQENPAGLLPYNVSKINSSEIDAELIQLTENQLSRAGKQDIFFYFGKDGVYQVQFAK